MAMETVIISHCFRIAGPRAGQAARIAPVER
jgi:hypothetical protein